MIAMIASGTVVFGCLAAAVRMLARPGGKDGGS
jgi:hypothetical protein